MSENYKDFWPDFNNGDFSRTYSYAGSVADKVLDTFNIPRAGSAGGSLKNIDIKNMDAMTVLKASLLEDTVSTGYLIEPIVNSDGEVVYKSIGRGGGSLSNRYYSLQTQRYVADKSGVLVTGGKPLPQRIMGDVTELLSDEMGATYFDDNNIYNEMHSNCSKEEFKKHALIIYNDPNLNSQYNDGIDNLYEINDENPFDRIVTYMYYISNSSTAFSADATITLSQTASVPIKVGEHIGELIRIKGLDVDADLGCFEGVEVNCEGSNVLFLELPPEFRYETIRGVTHDKFIKVSNVFVTGVQLDELIGVPIDLKAAKEGSKEENTVIVASVNTPVKSMYRLEEGIHYGAGYVDGKICIRFADRSNYTINAKYGDGVDAYIRPSCGAYKNDPVQNSTLSGLMRSLGHNTFSILPTDINRGIAVTQVWALIDFDTPSVVIEDPKGAAFDLARGMSIQVAPLILRQAPAPVAYNGNLINQADGMVDHDPTTVQNFTETEMEQVINDMNGGQGLTLSMASLDADAVVNLSRHLYGIFKNDNGIITTHICGPNCDPELGDNGPSGGVINEISYKYVDQGSYTVSVSEGPIIYGTQLQGITGGPYVKMAEDVSATGVVIEDGGTNKIFKVLVEGIGVRQAINVTDSIIRVGDRVNVTIHNNPVEA